jgi:hypothetical protein
MMRTIFGQFSGKVMQKYSVGACTVALVEEDGRIKYVLQDPAPTSEDVKLVEEMLREMVFEKNILSRENVEQYMWKVAEKMKMFDYMSKNFAKIKYFFVRETVGYGLIEALLSDENVGEIVCAGKDSPVHVSHSLYSSFMETNIILSEEELEALTRKLFLKCRTPPSNTLKGATEEGYIVFLLKQPPPLSTTFSIKKPRSFMKIGTLISSGAMDFQTAALLKILVGLKVPMIVYGAAKSGKTTMLSIIASLTPKDSRIVTIEKSPEIVVKDRMWVRLREGEHVESYTAFLKPDYVIVDDVEYEFKDLKSTGACIIRSCPTLPENYSGIALSVDRGNGIKVKLHEVEDGRVAEIRFSEENIVESLKRYRSLSAYAQKVFEEIQRYRMMGMKAFE